MKELVYNKTYENKNFVDDPLAIADYEGCTFINCNFNQCNLSELNFIECDFNTCNLSMVNMYKTGLKNIRLSGCRTTGVQFEECNPFLFAIHCIECPMEFSTFVQMDLKKSTFKDSQLINVDFSEADLTGLSFDGCDLYDAIFSYSILEKSDFRNARNYTINPESNRMRGSKHSIHQVRGLLEQYDLIIE